MNSSLPTRNGREELALYSDRMRNLASYAGIADVKKQRHPLHEQLAWLERSISLQSNDGRAVLANLGNGSKDGVIQDLREFLAAMSSLGWARMYWQEEKAFEELMNDPTNAKFLRDRLPHADFFYPTLSEIFYWGYLRARQIKSTLQQFEGAPDIKIEIGTECIFGDVKTLMPGFSFKNLGGVIRKANKQIKRVSSNGSGLCLLRIAQPDFRFVEPQDLRTEENYRPQIVTRVMSECERLLMSGHYKSVARIVVIWEEHLITGNIPGWMLLLATISSASVDHPNPVCKIDENPDFLPKATVTSTIEVRARS